jgi:hypothetical protein
VLVEGFGRGQHPPEFSQLPGSPVGVADKLFQAAHVTDDEARLEGNTPGPSTIPEFLVLGKRADYKFTP